MIETHLFFHKYQTASVCYFDSWIKAERSECFSSPNTNQFLQITKRLCVSQVDRVHSNMNQRGSHVGTLNINKRECVTLSPCALFVFRSFLLFCSALAIFGIVSTPSLKQHFSAASATKEVLLWHTVEKSQHDPLLCHDECSGAAPL